MKAKKDKPEEYVNVKFEYQQRINDLNYHFSIDSDRTVKIIFQDIFNMNKAITLTGKIDEVKDMLQAAIKIIYELEKKHDTTKPALKKKK